MNFWNERVLRETMADYLRVFGNNAPLGKKIKEQDNEIAELKARLEALEAKPKRGRPRAANES